MGAESNIKLIKKEDAYQYYASYNQIIKDGRENFWSDDFWE